jgi:hypothetical protein
VGFGRFAFSQVVVKAMGSNDTAVQQQAQELAADLNAGMEIQALWVKYEGLVAKLGD